MKKRVPALLLVFVLLISYLVSCGAPPAPTDETTTSEASDTSTEDSTDEQGEEDSTEETAAGEYDTVEYYSTISEYTEATGETVTVTGEAPELADMVASGDIASVEERVSAEPMVMVPLDEVGNYGGRIRIGATSPVTGSAESWTMRTESLLIIDSSLSGVAPNVAKGFEYNEDYTELTFFLREGMMWSDGEPFTADDFMFYYENMLMSDDIIPVKPSHYMVGGEMVEFVKVGDYEIKMVFAAPNPTIINVFANGNRMYHQTVPFAPAHYLEQFLPQFNSEADATAVEKGYTNWAAYFSYIYPDEVQAMMEAGVPSIDPWVLTEVDDVGNKFFDRNPYFWKVDTEGNQLPYIDGQDRLLNDMQTIEVMALAGELDAVLQFTDVSQYPLYVENEENGDYTSYMWVDGRGQVLANVKLNLNHPDPLKNELFNNLLFREALSLAINRDEINTIVFKGLATPRAGTVAPQVSYYEDAHGSYMAEFDIDMANQKLDEMGLTVGDDGFRVTADGEPVEINLEYAEVEGNTTTIMEMVKQYWDAVGVKTSIRIIDQTLYNSKNAAGELDAWTWNMDNTTEIGFHAGSRVLLPNAVEWLQYYNTDGAEGTEPSPEYIEYIETGNELAQYPMGEGDYSALGKQLLDINMENMWNIGIVGMTPKPMLISNKIGNTPAAGLYDYDYRFWMIFHPEQWYYK